MGVGHIAVALGASRAAPRVNVGWLVFAACLSDFLLGIFAWLGIEHASVPDNYATRHYLLFTFPYSHGLLALLGWAAIFGFLVSRGYGSGKRRVFILVGLMVLSHFVLDGLVHVAGLPLVGENSPKLGLGLWNHMQLELTLETVMSVVGVAVYWKLTGASSSAVGRYGIAAFVAIVAALTWTQLWATTPPEPRQLIPSWIVIPVVFGAVAYGLDRKRSVFLARTSS